MELANAVVRDFIEPMKKYSADSAKELAVSVVLFSLDLSRTGTEVATYGLRILRAISGGAICLPG